MSMDLFVARTMIANASLVYRGPVTITGTEVDVFVLVFNDKLD